MSIVIDIAAQFTGKKAFTQAENAADKLARNVKQALIGVGVTAFAKSAISAFAAQEKQLAVFKNSLRSIGFEFATSDSLAFLNSLKLQFGVADEQLIPAYEKLLTSTRSLAASQNLTNIALDIAARQNITVTEAADALSKAYLGNTRSLGALGLGISKTTLASGDFAKIIKEVTFVTKGAASAAATTFAGKLAKLKVAADSAKESIGAGLVEAIMRISGATDIDQLQTKIINFGESTSQALIRIGQLIRDNIVLVKSFAAVLLAAFTINKIAAFITALGTIVKTVKTLRNALLASAIARNFLFSPLGAAAMTAGMFAAIGLMIKGVDAISESATKATGNLQSMFAAGGSMAGGDQGGAAKFAEGAAARAAKEAKAAALAQLKATNAQTKAIKDQAKLKKASGLLDMEQIQIMAALQNKLTADEKLRLSLQLALLTENASEADRLSNELALSQLQTTNLASAIKNLPPALNPLQDYPSYINKAIGDIALVQDALNKLKAPVLTVQVNTVNTGGAAAPIGSAPQTVSPQTFAGIPSGGDIGGAAKALEYAAARNQITMNTQMPDWQSYRAGERETKITVNVQGNVISNRDLTDSLRMGLLDSSASGSFTLSNRATRGD
jgi:hypothetical protein